MKAALLFAVMSVGVAHAEPSRNARTGRLAELAFEHGSSAIPIATTEKAQLAVGKAAAWAHENPDGLLVIDGHADRRGPRADNVRLSLARAQTVKSQLELAGVPEEQIVIAAYGEARSKRTVVIWGTSSEHGDDAVATP
jgi:outer membrane protein OmpA-like peptidoglycan-associated protein